MMDDDRKIQYWGSPKNPIFRGWSWWGGGEVCHEKNIGGIQGDIDIGGCLKMEAWTVCRFKRVLVKKRGWSL